MSRIRAVLRFVGGSPHPWALLAFLLATWTLRFGCAVQDLATRSFAGHLDDDVGQFVFCFRHLAEALGGRRPLLHSDHFFFPLGVDLIQQDWAPAAAVMALPFQPLGPLAALNLEVLAPASTSPVDSATRSRSSA